MKIEVNIEKKHFFMILSGILVLIAVFAVQAFTDGNGGNPAVMGHSVDEIDWNNIIPTNIAVNGTVSSNSMVTGGISAAGQVSVSSLCFNGANCQSGWPASGGVHVGSSYTIGPYSDITGGLICNAGSYVTALWYSSRTARWQVQCTYLS